MRKFKGRIITPGTAKATAVVTHGGFNTLASMQMGLQFGDKQVKCSDQSNPEIYKLPLAGSALCLPQTIGSTTGGLVLYCACAILASVWLDGITMPVIDNLGDEFLEYVKNGMTVTVEEDGTVVVE